MPMNLGSKKLADLKIFPKIMLEEAGITMKLTLCVFLRAHDAIVRLSFFSSGNDELSQWTLV